ncbi:hypothetical protein OE88DRAFT_1649806 [Heliocybe sulcata]|uniref:SAM domain-containing protein n=1 Tax=Heliocybe sulcata TaxID=5364 RepID=A0A5C3NGH3_9AGAM|nr:hypothetical protein OE88DRAFT_1649806 [Heliocybe sulcata]
MAAAATVPPLFASESISSPESESLPTPLTPSESPFKSYSNTASPSRHAFPGSPSPAKNYTTQSPLTSPTLDGSKPKFDRHNSKPKFEPNPHPYAIKTTSTALLARSNSSSGNVNAQRHTYIPVPPSPSSGGAGAPTSPSHSRGNNSSGSGGHRYTKSLTGVQDIPILPPGALGNGGGRPLPVPPGAASASTPDLSLPETPPPRRMKRSDTLPGMLPSTPPPPSPSFSLDDLPENPKLWTPSQLSAYLTSALRVRGGEGEGEGPRLPGRVASDVAAFVRQSRIGGRAFLRLNEADLEGMGVNKLWRGALLKASRNLRQNVLKGRIWPSPTASPNPNSSDNSDMELQAPSSPGGIYRNTLYASSDSSLSSVGEVEGIVATPFTKVKRSRVKVRERVKDFEERSRSRSASEVSDSDNSSAAGEAKAERIRRIKSRPLPTPPMNTTSPVPPSRSQASSTAPSPSPSVRRQLPKPPYSYSDHEEEPSMEVLLAQQEKSSWGAKAWEDIDDGLGIVTVKHVPGEALPAGTVNGSKGVTLNGKDEWMKGTISRGTANRKGKERGRVVTSIFQGLDENGTGVSRESSGDSEEGATAADVGGSTAAEVEKDTVVLVTEPIVKDEEIQLFGGASVDAEVQSLAGVTADAEVQSLVVPTVDAEVQSPAVVTANAEVQSPIIVTSDAQVQSPILATAGVEVQSIVSTADAEVQSAVISATNSGVQARDADEDEQDGAVQDLERKLRESRASVEALRKRLESVEKDIEKMETQSTKDVPAPPSTSAPLVPASRAVGPPRTRPGLATKLVNRLFSMVGLGSPASNLGPAEREMEVGDLPSYVFLVSLGVCAVVIKVLAKRMRRGLR